MRVLPTVFCAVVVLSSASACGPVQSTAHIIDADTQLESARALGAEKHAPYESTLSERYLRKAREQVGRSKYESAIELAQKALKHASAAKARAQAARRLEPSKTAPSVPPAPNAPSDLKPGP